MRLTEAKCEQSVQLLLQEGRALVADAVKSEKVQGYLRIFLEAECGDTFQVRAEG
jgi:hypothetical protein